MLHKQHGKELLMVRNYARYHSEKTISWISRSSPLTPPAKRDFTSDLLYEGVQWALKPSGFCNVKVNPI
jgi:hypothetical protein